MASSEAGAPSTDPVVATALLEMLVATPSPSGGEARAVRALVDWMAARGFATTIDGAGNAVGTRGTGPREILLLGHIDTVPGADRVRRAGRRLFGRGSVDAKGPLCMFASAAAAVEVPPEWRLTVVGAVEEESWTSLGARHVVETRAGGAPPACVVVGEPSRWDRVALGYRGSVEVLVTLRAPFAHSAGREPLPAARGVEVWHEVERFCDDRNRGRASREFDRYAAALRQIETRDDGAYGLAALRIGLRLPPGERLTDLERDLPQHLRKAVGSWQATGCRLDIEFRGGQVAFRADKRTALVSAFLRAIREEGGDPRFVVKTGTSDLTIVGPAWPGVPMAVYGPGDGALDHTPDEHVDLDEYLRAVRVLRRVLEELTAAARS